MNPGNINTSSLETLEPHALNVSGLKAGYQGTYVVENVGLSLHSGEVVGLVGNNGSGKSTILLGIAGATEHECDRIEIFGFNVAGYACNRRMNAGLGFLLQNQAVFANISVEDNLRIAKFNAEFDYFEYFSKETIEFIDNIVSREKTIAGDLSGGERRLLGLIMALSSGPIVFLCDEPTLGLSQNLECDIIKSLCSCFSEKGRAMLIVSHNRSALESHCSKIYTAVNGKVEPYSGID